MPVRLTKSVFYAFSFVACTIMAFTTGCASGGFKLTREYASFVNRQEVILRVIIYIFTGIVFFVTLLIDMVINNTIDFWNGTVAAGDYSFAKDGKTYQAHHEILPDSLKRSTIKVFDKDQKLVQTVMLQETATHEIEMSVDGKLRARVKDLKSIPVASVFDEQGALVQTDFIFSGQPLMAFAASAQ